MGVPGRPSSGMEATHPPPEEQVAEKPNLENGGSCNSGDEGIDTTEPVDEIEGNETGEPVGKTEEFEKSGSTDKIEENGSSEPADHEEEPIGEVADQVEEEQETKDETIEGETGEIEATEKQEENAESTTTLMEEQEKSSREILLEKRCSLTHTPDIARVLDKEAAKAHGEVHEFQKVKSELKAVEEPQVAELKISHTYEGVSEETGQSENQFVQSNVTTIDFEEVTTDAPAEEEEEEEEVAETIIELTLAPTPMIMDLTPAPVEMVNDSKVTEKKGGGAESASKGKNE